MKKTNRTNYYLNLKLKAQGQRPRCLSALPSCARFSHGSSYTGTASPSFLVLNRRMTCKLLPYIFTSPCICGIWGFFTTMITLHFAFIYLANTYLALTMFQVIILSALQILFNPPHNNPHKRQELYL